MIELCPVPISLLVWVHSFIEPDVLKILYRFDNTSPIYLINLLWKLGLGFVLDSQLHFFAENKESEHLRFREFHER